MKICIVGLGVIGGSYALALKEAGYKEVYGIDNDTETLKTAKEMGIIIEGFTSGGEILNECDVVILSLYPNSIINFIRDNEKYLKHGAVLTDATGIKESIVDKIEKCLRDDVEFVFGHPMAGREKKGIFFASGEVFKGANYIITPTERTSEQAMSMIEKLAYSIGFKRVTRISPVEHDALIAFTSQLPHVLAVALINSDDEKYDTGKFIGDSYRELTRISNINGPLWTELFLHNKKNLLHCIDNFENQLDMLKKSIKENDAESLKDMFEKSSSRREMLEL